MPYSKTSSEGDLEKLQVAFAEILHKFGSVQNVWEAFGLSELPTAQRYGILGGSIVFAVTVLAVLTLLALGGSFQRMAEQERGTAAPPSSTQSRLERPLLLERLLQARDYLIKNTINMTSVLLQRPPTKESSSNPSHPVNVKRPDLAQGYPDNYVVAYRKRQDQPGGTVVPGRPEARFEAYARAYAACGDHTMLRYRRSYARVYEVVACATETTDDSYLQLYKESPQALVGKSCHLTALRKEDATSLFAATSGEIYCYQSAYDPQEIWGFQEVGPFASPQQMEQALSSTWLSTSSSFCIWQTLSGRLLGMIRVVRNDPTNLTIQLEPPLVAPTNRDKSEAMEASFLLMDKLFALGYRRIQCSVDAQDAVSHKWADRMGFTLEGVLLKDKIVKESNRDSQVYGMLNSDWDKGARISLFHKLYGKAVARADLAYNKKQEEIDEQSRGLDDQKQAADTNSSKDKNA